MAQPYMTDLEAKETIEGMVEAHEREIGSLKNRIDSLKAEYAVDKWEETATQIRRLEDRLVVRGLQAAALKIAVAKF